MIPTEAEIINSFYGQEISEVIIATKSCTEFIQNHNGWQLFDTSLSLFCANGSCLTFYRHPIEELPFLSTDTMPDLFNKNIEMFNQSENIYWKQIAGKHIEKIEFGWEDFENLRIPVHLLITFSNYQELLLAAVRINTTDQLSFSLNLDEDLLATFDKKMIKEILE